MISYIGQEGYCILKSLTAPDKPNTKVYAALKTLMTEHLDPKPTPLAERYKFFRLQQGQLKVSDWRAKLAYASTLCNFAAAHRTEALRDQFIFGLSDEKTRIVLMAEENITLDNAYKKALSREHAEEDNKLISTKSVNYLGKPFQKKRGAEGFSPRPQKSGVSGNNKGNTNSNTCNRCKLPCKTSKCTKSECKTKCFNCDLIGHTRNVCRKPSKIHNVE